ncbi:aldose 1-epimerase [Teredinibacter turnerae]|uniref:aldose 1-epimerase n=1 Tax=Teredinibacter turnerae TaxID=2426 RepID=UPI0005F844F0|nr:aldose epimerase [Teredinibacter turnerae]
MKDYDAVELAAGASRLELVPEFGGLINGLQLTLAGRTVDLVAGLPDRAAMASNNYYRGVALYPSLNRMDGGAYEHNGERYQFVVNETERNNNLHGFLYTLAAAAESLQNEGDSGSVSLRYPVDGSYPGYPFAADVVMHYTLEENALVMEFEVTNRHAAPVPVGLGWHPYFCIGGTSVSDMLLQLPAVEAAQVNDRMLPTGEMVRFDAYDEPAAIAERQFDHCFRLLDVKSSRRVSTRLWSPADRLGLEVWQDAGELGYNFIQVCIPPDRQSIAIEPMTCGINAFNTGDGLLTLTPGQTLRTRCGVRLINQP